LTNNFFCCSKKDSKDFAPALVKAGLISMDIDGNFINAATLATGQTPEYNSIIYIK
jgi:hypothetical protein